LLLGLSFHSAVVDLGTVTSDAAGRFREEVRIPANATPGQHQIVVSGLDQAGAVHQATLEVVVVGASSPRTTPLVRTGSRDAPYLSFAVGLVLAGCLLLRVAATRPFWSGSGSPGRP